MVAIELLESRALLSTVAAVSPLQVQPMGVHPSSRNATQSQVRNGNVGDALHVGGQYTKAVFSTPTGTVISNYTKALLRGDGKELRSLGNSSAVHQLNASFTSTANSPQAQAIHHSLSSFGHSISKEFHKIFG
jgi:hypothetical protein